MKKLTFRILFLFYFNNVRVIKSSRTGWMRHLACMVKVKVKLSLYFDWAQRH